MSAEKTLMWHVCRVLWHEGVTCDEYTDTPEDQASLTSIRNEGAARCPHRSVLLLAQATVDLSSV